MEGRYPDDRPADGVFDLVLFSYALSMFNPGWHEALQAALESLSSTGRLAFVDFHETPVSGFEHWMGLNHVRMNGHLLPELQSLFGTSKLSIHKAFFGVWSYFLFQSSLSKGSDHAPVVT